MNYKDYNDYEILSYIEESNEEAIDVLFEKYQPLINATANRMLHYCKNTSLELNDLIQEGMLGLNIAIRSFDVHKETSFYTYARMCIERKIISLIVSARRLKHRFLNESVSLEIAGGFDDIYENQKCLEDNSFNPEDILVASENEEELLNKAKEVLADFEYQVFELKRNGFNYREIAEILDKDTKAVDNAIQRIKGKIKDLINNKVD